MKPWVPVLLGALCLLPATAAAESPKQLTWDAFAARLDVGSAIRIVLPDGTLIEGKPGVFRPEGLDLRVYKTSNRRAHPKGLVTIRARP